MDNIHRNIVHVYLSHFPLKMYNSLQVELLRSMKRYGTVLQICKHTSKFGRFLEKFSVILDIGDDTNERQFAELSRMVYLEKEDIYIPATYKGAPKVCNQCRVAGHIRQECPELANVQCYNCKAYGHLRRHCKKEVNDCSENEKEVEYQNLEEYIEECIEARIRAAMEGEPDSEMETDSTAEDPEDTEIESENDIVDEYDDMEQVEQEVEQFGNVTKKQKIATVSHSRATAIVANRKQEVPLSRAQAMAISTANRRTSTTTPAQRTVTPENPMRKSTAMQSKMALNMKTSDGHPSQLSQRTRKG